VGVGTDGKYLKADSGEAAGVSWDTPADADAIHDNVAQEIQPITGKATPVDDDVALIEDSAASWVKKSLSWANIKATLKTYFDSLYSGTGHDHSGVYAPAADGVTGGDSHDHDGGDGAQIDHTKLSNIGSTTHADIDTHVGATNNPHSVTKTQVGLTNVTDDAQIAKSLGTTKGDLIAFSASATPTRVDVGTDGKYLKADSGAAAGVSWDTPAGGGGLSATISGTAGENLAEHDLCYLKSDGKFWKAKADAEATMPGMVLAPSALSAEDPGDFIRRGEVTNAGWSWTPGGLIYASEATAGALTQTAPSGSGEQLQIVGTALSATKIDFDPNMMLIEVA
jgi:hypothetical protein